jgi:hypothetical protein
VQVSDQCASINSNTNTDTLFLHRYFGSPQVAQIVFLRHKALNRRLAVVNTHVSCAWETPVKQLVQVQELMVQIENVIPPDVPLVLGGECVASVHRALCALACSPVVVIVLHSLTPHTVSTSARHTLICCLPPSSRQVISTRSWGLGRTGSSRKERCHPATPTHRLTFRMLLLALSYPTTTSQTHGLWKART